MDSSRLLLISAGLNVLLFAGLGNVLFDEPALTSIPPALTPTVSMPVASLETRQADAAPKPIRFQWQQLEADDYPTYISNLRNAGVPERTLSQIVTAEIAAEFESKRQEITAQPATTESERAQKGLLLERLPQEQAAVVAGLLSRQSAAPGLVTQSTSGIELSESEDAPFGVVAALYPAALVLTDPDVPRTPRQLAELEKLQKDFVAEVGGPGQSPSDPDYGDRWMLAQRRSDGLFRLKFGTQAFLRQNAEAGRMGRTE